MQHCLSVLRHSEVRSCIQDFPSSPIEKSPADLDWAMGRPQVGGNPTLIKKFAWETWETHGIRWHMRMSIVLLQPTSALRFLYLGHKLLNNILVHIPSDCWCEKNWPHNSFPGHTTPQPNFFGMQSWLAIFLRIFTRPHTKLLELIKPSLYFTENSSYTFLYDFVV